MNEQACAFVCAILTLLAFVLSAYTLKTGDMSCWWVTLAFSSASTLLSGFVIICRHV